jgi:hypothetical protein
MKKTLIHLALTLIIISLLAQPAVIATQPRKDAPNILMILARVI